MSTAAVIMMIIDLSLVWGLLAIATKHLASTDDAHTGTLGAKELDDMPLYQPTSRQAS